jgi:hypothetical protein
VGRPTAAYRLNPEMSDVLGSTLIRIIVRGEEVIGHYGRHGYIKGVLRGRELSATLRDETNEGSLDATFDEDFTMFDGRYATALGSYPHERQCFGTRVTRRKAQI